MRNVILFFLSITFVCSCLAQSVQFGDTEFSIKVEAYRPSIIIVGMKSIESQSPPEWWSPYRAIYAVDEFDSYEGWERFFSSEYKKRFNFSEQLFDGAKTKMKNPPEWVPEFRSAFYSVRISIAGGREFIVLKSANGKISDWNDDLLSMDLWTQTHFFEKIDGVWVNQTIDAIGFVADLPYENILSLRQIVDLGVFVVGDKIPLTKR